jgi:glutamate synthase domain-containing protein 2
VVGRIAEVRGLPEGTAAVSPARFVDWTTLLDARALVDRIRERSAASRSG